MKHAHTLASPLLLRRALLKAGSVSLAMLLGSPRTMAASATGNQPIPSGRIIGLTTLGKADSTLHASELLSLDLSNGQQQLSPLDGYREGHSLTALPNGEYFAVPYSEEENPCLFLDSDFAVIAQVFAPQRHGFGGHAVLLPDNKTLFTHFNKMGRRRGRTANDTGKLCQIDIATRKVIQSTESDILHGHDIIVSRDQQTVILADDGNIETPVPDDSPYTVISHQPALHLFDARTLSKIKTVHLPINGSLVHIEEGEDHRIYGGTEQFVLNNDAGKAILDETTGNGTSAFLASLPEGKFTTDAPLPGPLIGINLDNLELTSSTRVEHIDPFGIRLNLQTGLLFCVFISSNQLARYNPQTRTWRYFPTHGFNIDEPYGLIEIPNSPFMVINGYKQGIAIFNAMTMSLERYYDIPTHGMKHMLYLA